jgi:predicted Zn-dependent protease
MRGGIYGRQANNNLEPALRFYQPLVDNDSSLTAPYLEIGRIYNNIGEYETGNLQFIFGLERDPQNVLLQAELARGYYSSQQTERGDSLLHQLVRQEPQHPEVLRLQGFAAEMKGQSERALGFYVQVAAELPFDRTAYLAAAPLCERLRRTEDGLRLIDQALRYNKRNPELWYWYARFAGPFGLEDDARGAFAQAIELAFTEADRQRYRRGKAELGY